MQTQTYDVTGLLQEGENVLTAELADGWYRGSCGAWGLKNQYGIQTKLLAQLELTGEDGRVSTLRSGGSWSWSSDGPIRFADNKDGEIVDARLAPSYVGKARVAAHKTVPTPSDNFPVTAHERFDPTMTTSPNGKKLLDFGQNIAGWLGFRLQAKAGQTVRVRCGELLDADGNLTLKNIQCTRKDFATPRQEILYTCKEGENAYEMAFSVFGFRYAEVDFAAGDFYALAVYSDMEQAGFFESSNEPLNRFVDCTLWLFMPKNRATTIWESWEGTQAQGGIASLNHYSKGAVCEWLFRTMCGIQIAGVNRFVIAPRHLLPRRGDHGGELGPGAAGRNWYGHRRGGP